MKNEIDLEEDGILKEHNIETYLDIQEMFQDEKRVGLVQATGTGKSFIAMQWLFDNALLNDKKALILSPTRYILDQFDRKMSKVCLDKSKFNLQEGTYSNLLNLKDDDFKNLKYDYIILDEFHRLGAKEWGKATQKLLDNNKEAKVLGLSATPIRYLDGRRDMSKELFGDAVVSGVQLCDAIENNILPKPEYVTAVYSYEPVIESIYSKISKIKDDKKRNLFFNRLEKLKRKAQEAEGLEDIFGRRIKKKDGKFIIFCSDFEQMNEIKSKVNAGLFDKVNKKVEMFSVSYNNTLEEIRKRIEKFENDDNDTLKIMVAINMFNEGLHIDGLDGAMMFRPTISPRIYLQQIGRVLAVGIDKDPIVFDVVNNISNLKDYAEIFIQGKAQNNDFNEDENEEIVFNIDDKDVDLPSLLYQLDALVNYHSATKEQYLNCARKYVEEHGDLMVGSKYEDLDSGINLGAWIYRTRNFYINNHNSLIDKDLEKKLLDLDLNVFKYTKEYITNFNVKKYIKDAQKFYEKYGHLHVTKKLWNDLKKEYKNERNLLNLVGDVRCNKRKCSLELENALKEIDPMVFEYGKRDTENEKVK